MFGTFSADGFDALALLDRNADGKINTLDAKFSESRIWRDLNGNGAVDSGEMQSLAEAWLANIGLRRKCDDIGKCQHDAKQFLIIASALSSAQRSLT